MKGLFTQGVAVLFSEPPSLAQLRALLEDYEITSENPLGSSQWQMESASFHIACLPEVNGSCVLDVVVRPWPDHLSSSEREPALHAAWSLGHFGPFTATGSLARAVEHAHRWEHAEHLAPQHQAFVRMRISYSLNAPGQLPQLPPDYDPLPELEWLITLAGHVCKHPRAVAYFNPNGEVLLSPDGLKSVLEDAAHSEAPPLDAIINVRLAHINGWQLVDTVGMGQLDLPDQEIVCPDEVSSSEELSSFLYDAAFHMATTETPIVTDNSTFGPGGTEWLASTRISSLRGPARTIVHWTEIEGPAEPADFYVPVVEEELWAEYDGEHPADEPYSAIDDPAMWEVAPHLLQPPPPARRGPLQALLGNGGGSPNGCLRTGLFAALFLVALTALFWPGLKMLFRSHTPPPAQDAAAATDWEQQAAAVLQNWSPNADMDAKAQAVPPGAYHLLTGEGRAGSAFIMRYAGSQIFCGVSTLHQYDFRTPASMDGPAGLKVLLDNQSVLKLRDIQVQQVTEVSRPFECLEYDPGFILRAGDELVIPKGDGEFIKGKMSDSIMMVDKFVSAPGRSQDFTLKLEQPFEFKGYSGSPVIHLATGKVVGVLRAGDASKTIIGFETLSLGPLPRPPQPDAK